MPSKRTEFGRSLIETLAVLVVIAILLLAGLAGYNFTIHKYKKDQTVKAISELAVRYKLHPISTTGAVNIKSIYPEAERADAVNMRTADIETGRVRLEVSEDNSYFAVVVNSILDDSCAEYLEKGEYDAALLLNGDKYNSKTDTEYLAFGKDFLKDFDLSKLTAEQKDKLRALTNGNTSKEAVIHVICSGAPQAKTAALVFGDKCPKRGASHWYQGKCWPCPGGQKEDRYGVCCSEAQINSKESCYSCGCPSGTHCDGTGPDATGQCVECLAHEDCKEAGKKWCDKERHVCVQCTEEGGCENDPNGCPTHCNLKTHTCSNACDLNTGLWRLSGDICVCNKTLQEGDACSTTCGVDCCPPKSPCKSGRCCPTDLPEYNDLCVAGCGCNSDAHLVCNSGNRCVCDELNDYYWDESAKQCVKGCRFGGLYKVDELVGTCGICQTGGTIGKNTSAGNVCQQCNETTWELEWVDSTQQNVVTHSGTDTCCANDGTQGSECASDSCCSDTAPSCVSKGADGKGHCCPANTTWNGQECVDAPMCQATEGDGCADFATAETNPHFCCAAPLRCAIGHCCPEDSRWNVSGVEYITKKGKREPKYIYGCVKCGKVTEEGCCNGEIRGCDGVCGSRKVVGCDGVCGSGKVYDCFGTCGGTARRDCAGTCGGSAVDTGCGCGVYDRTAEGCCPWQVKDCAGVCGGSAVDAGCGCGVALTAEGCCQGQVKGCDGVCGSGKVDVGCGCGKCCSDSDCPVCQTCCSETGPTWRTCVYGGTANGRKYGDQVCYNANYRTFVPGQGYVNYERRGLYDCWQKLSQSGSTITYKNLHTNEQISLTSTQVNNAYVGGCLLDPREYWLIAD